MQTESMVMLLERDESEAPAPLPTNSPKRRRAEWIGPLIVALTFVICVAHIWGRSLDPVIDFGRELYTPWQLSLGRHLYADIAAFYGPLSQYFNALVFRIFGPGLLTLMCVNVLILAAATALLYALLRSIASQFAATAATALFIVMFGCAHVGAVGNFNFVTPYSHEATHGFVLSIAALFALARFLKTQRLRWAALLGFCVGLVFLTKPEIFVALAGAVAAGIGTLICLRRKSGGNIKIVGPLATSALVPVGAAFLLLCAQLGAASALNATTGAWRLMGNSGLMKSSFYANSTGLQSPTTQLALILKIAALFAAVLLPALVAGLFIKSRGKAFAWLMAAAGALSAILVVATEGLAWWQWASEMLFLATAAIMLTQCVVLVRRRKELPRDAAPIIKLALITFALLMLLKMFLHTRFHQYGFVLAAMATVVLAVALLDWLPSYIEARRRNGSALRGAALVALTMLAVVSVTVSARDLATLTHPVGEGANRFLTDDRAAQINDMTAYIDKNSTPDQTLTVLPEGIMLNVLTHRRTAIPYLSTIPSDLLMFGEPAILRSLENARPDFVAILDRPTADFGKQSFGKDYALAIRGWLVKNYHPVHLSGAVPFTSDNFGILLLQRNNNP